MPVTTLDPMTALVLIDLQRGVTAMPTVHPADDVVATAAHLVAAWRRHQLPVLAVHVAFSPDGGDVLRTRTDAPAPASPLPADFADLRPELGLAPGDLVITKHGWNAFYSTDLDLQLRRRGVTGIVLAGISTSIGVESTARAAAERSYQVAFAVDAMTDLVAGAHANSLAVCRRERVFSEESARGGRFEVKIRATDAILPSHSTINEVGKLLSDRLLEVIFPRLGQVDTTDRIIAALDT